jgi:hypothetical protein
MSNNRTPGVVIEYLQRMVVRGDGEAETLLRFLGEPVVDTYAKKLSSFYEAE